MYASLRRRDQESSAPDIYTVVITVANISSLAQQTSGAWQGSRHLGPHPISRHHREAAGQSRLPVALPAPPPPDCARDTMSHFGPQL